jgi:hypothetical protein
MTTTLVSGVFQGELARELDRAARYGRGLTLVLFSASDDVEALAASLCRASDLKGRVGDDLAVALLEADRHASGRHGALRYVRRLAEHGIDVDAAWAHYPSDGGTVDELLSWVSLSPANTMSSSGGSGERVSMRSPVSGCGNASSAAWRNWRASPASASP